MKQRDKLLADMTDEVGELVLRDNYLQSQAISIAENQSFRLLDQQGRFMRSAERAGRLDCGRSNSCPMTGQCACASTSARA